MTLPLVSMLKVPCDALLASASSTIVPASDIDGDTLIVTNLTVVGTNASVQRVTDTSTGDVSYHVNAQSIAINISGQRKKLCLGESNRVIFINVTL
jgi:hypothetical protein